MLDTTETKTLVNEFLGPPMDYSIHCWIACERSSYPGSRQWMFDRFDAWKKTHNAMFVLISAAGMGKTSWAAKLVEDHEKHNVVAWHFCKFDQAVMSKPKRMLFSLASQLVANVASYGVAFSKVVKRALAPGQTFTEYRRQLLDKEPLSELFRVFFQEPFAMIGTDSKGKTQSPMIVLVDALDEVDAGEKNHLVNCICSLATKLPSLFKFVLTTRPEKPYKERLDRFDPEWIHNDEKNNQDDIMAYVHSKLSACSLMPNQFEQIAQSLVSRFDGNFQYAKLCLEHLCHVQTPLSTEMINVLPAKLEGLYSDEMRLRVFPTEEYDDKGRDFACSNEWKIVEFVYAAAVPLSIEAVCDLLEVSPVDAKRAIARLSVFLATSREKSAQLQRITFHHKSVRDWLAANSEEYHIDDAACHGRFGILCYNRLLQTFGKREENKTQMTNWHHYQLCHTVHHLMISHNLPSVQVDVEGNVSLRGSQNVRILINGKPSGLTGTDNPDALRLLQSNLIERVEVITNPSARYDAEGEVGIINIVLKKNRKSGINGAFDLGLGVPHNHNAAYNLNLRKGWVNLFSSFGISYRNSPGGGDSRSQFLDVNSLTVGEETFAIDNLVTHNISDRTRADLGATFRTGADFFINNSNTLTFSGLYRFSEGDNDTEITYEDFDGGSNTLLQHITRNQFEDESDENIEFALNYKKTFEKEDQVLTADFRWFVNNDTELADIFEENQTTLDPTILQRITNGEDEGNWFFQTDYVHPFAGKNRLETGIRTTLRTIDNDYLVEEQNDQGIWEAIPEFDNQFEYQENIYAAYFILNGESKRFTWQLGLRGEYSDILTISKEDDESNQRQYFDPFPSVHFSYKLNKNSDLQLSYSRRISRPGFRSLLPFSNFSDARNFRSGNPDLNPEYTNSLETSYLRNWKSGSLLSSVYYRHRTGVIERIVLDQSITSNDNSEGTTVRIPVNLSTENNTGFEFNLEQDIASWWNMSANMNFYYSSTEGQYQEQNYARETFTWNGRFNSKISLKKWFDFQMNVNYIAPQNTTQGKRKSITTIDLAFARDILKNNGTLTLSVRDLLNSRKYRYDIIEEDYISTGEFQWRRTQVTLGFNYRLNQGKRRGRGSM